VVHDVGVFVSFTRAASDSPDDDDEQYCQNTNTCNGQSPQDPVSFLSTLGHQFLVRRSGLFIFQIKVEGLRVFA